MVDVPEGAKKPQDRKSKPQDEEVPEAFSFEHDGTTYTLAKTADTIRPGFLRKNRKNENELDVTYQALELLADEEQLEVLDAMSWAEYTKVLKDLTEHIDAFFKVSLGE